MPTSSHLAPVSEPTPSPSDRRLNALKRALEKRLVKRATTDGVVYTLDLRQKRYEQLPSKRVTLRRPGDPGWPNTGATTDDEEVAKEWINDKYAEWIGNQLALESAAAGSASLTVREAAQRLVDSFKVTTQLSDGTVVDRIPDHKKSRVSMLRRNVLPALGHLKLAQLDAKTVGDAIDNLRIRKTSESGTTVKVPAEAGTKRNFKSALSEVWRHTYKYERAPFRDVRIEEPEVLSSESYEVEDYEDDSWLGDDRTGALDPQQLTRVLVAAMYLDRELMRRPNLRELMIPNTAHAIALQATMGTRLIENCKIRWGHMFNAGYTIIHNAKVKQVGVERRAVPTQNALLPWLEDLRAMEGRPIPAKAFVIRTNPSGDWVDQAAANTIARRIAMALELAGVKIPRKATHPLRATYASQMEASQLVSAGLIKRYLGHHRVYKTSTDKYIRQLVSMMKKSHRSVIRIPSPARVRAMLDTFEPAPVQPWKKRRKPKSRSRAAKEARRAQPRRRLGASLDVPENQ